MGYEARADETEEWKKKEGLIPWKEEKQIRVWATPLSRTLVDEFDADMKVSALKNSEVDAGSGEVGRQRKRSKEGSVSLSRQPRRKT